MIIVFVVIIILLMAIEIQTIVLPRPIFNIVLLEGNSIVALLVMMF